MTNHVLIPIEQIEVQLENGLITSPVVVTFNRDAVKLHWENENKFRQVSIELRGSKVVCVTRGIGNMPRVEEVFNFASA